MFNENLEIFTRKQLDAELDLYRENPVEDKDGNAIVVADGKALKKNVDVIAEIKRLREIAGYPYALTETDFAKNPSLAEADANGDSIGIGDVVYLNQGEVDEMTREAALAEIAAKEKADKEAADIASASTTSPEVEDEHAIHNPPAPHGPDADLVYKGKTVIRYSNKIVHGRRYIEVDCSSETYTITPEEFADDVKERAHA